MKINELKDKSKVDVIELKVINKHGEKEAGTSKVCRYDCSDDTGEVSMSLWGEDIDKVDIDDNIVITNGWCTEFNKKLVLSTGKYGKLEVKGDNNVPVNNNTISQEEKIALRMLTGGLVIFEHDFDVVIKIIEQATGHKCRDPMALWAKYKELRKSDVI